MAEMTNFLENEVYDDVLRNATYTGPADVYLAIYSVAPGEAGGGTEITDDGRKIVTFGAPTNGVGTNTNEVTFAITTATMVVAIALLDAAAAGNMLMYTTIASLGPTVSGDTIRFAIGSITATFQ